MTRTARWTIGIAIVLSLGLFVAGAVGLSVYLFRKSAHQQRLLVEAYQAVRNSDCDTAIAKFDEALKQRLADFAASEAYANRAYCYSARAQREEALRDYSESIRLYPRIAWAFEARGVLHEDNGDPEKAFRDYSEAIRLDPNAHEALQRRARIFLARNDVENAITDLKEAIRVWPNNAQLHAALGEAQLLSKDLDRARASFDTAIQLDPNHSRAYASRAETHRLQGRSDKAVTDEARARAIDGARASLWRGLNAGPPTSGDGVDLITQGDSALVTARYDAAIENYDKALASPLSKENASVAYMNRGNAYLRKGDFARAREDYDRAVQENPRNAGARVNRAQIYLDHDIEVTIAECTTALDIDPQLGEAYINRGFAFGRKKERRKAIADFQAAIKLNSPRVEVALNSLGWLRATSPDGSIRNAKEAMQAATKACELTEWQNPAFLDTLAAAYAESGDFGKAIDWQSKAIALIPEGKLREELEERRQLYRTRKPYREE